MTPSRPITRSHGCRPLTSSVAFTSCVDGAAPQQRFDFFPLPQAQGAFREGVLVEGFVIIVSLLATEGTF